MAQTIGTVLIDVKADTQKLVLGFDKAEKTVSKTARAMKNAVVGLAGAYLSFQGIDAFKNTIAGTIESADNLGKLADKLAISASALSELEYASGFANVSLSQLNASMSAMIRRVSNFKRDGTGAGAKAMEDLGISVEFANKNFTDTETTFKILLDKLSLLPDGFKKTAIAQDLFSKSASDVVRLANMGTVELERLYSQGKLTGAVISDDLANNSAIFNDELNKLSKTIGGVANNITADMLPTLTEMVKSLEDNLDNILETTKQLGLMGLSLVGAIALLKTSAIVSRNLATANLLLGGSYGAVNSKILLATVSQVAFNKVLKASPLGLATTAVYLLSESFIDANDRAKAFSNTLTLVESKSRLKKVVKELKDLDDRMKGLNLLQKKALGLEGAYNLVFKEREKILKNIAEIEKKSAKETKKDGVIGNEKELKTILSIMEKVNKTLDPMASKTAEINKRYDEYVAKLKEANVVNADIFDVEKARAKELKTLAENPIIVTFKTELEQFESLSTEWNNALLKYPNDVKKVNDFYLKEYQSIEDSNIDKLKLNTIDLGSTVSTAIIDGINGSSLDEIFKSASTSIGNQLISGSVGTLTKGVDPITGLALGVGLSAVSGLLGKDEDPMVAILRDIDKKADARNKQLDTQITIFKELNLIGSSLGLELEKQKVDFNKELSKRLIDTETYVVSATTGRKIGERFGDYGQIESVTDTFDLIVQGMNRSLERGTGVIYDSFTGMFAGLDYQIAETDTIINGTVIAFEDFNSLGTMALQDLGSGIIDLGLSALNSTGQILDTKRDWESLYDAVSGTNRFEIQSLKEDFKKLDEVGLLVNNNIQGLLEDLIISTSEFDNIYDNLQKSLLQASEYSETIANIDFNKTGTEELLDILKTEGFSEIATAVDNLYSSFEGLDTEITIAELLNLSDSIKNISESTIISNDNIKVWQDSFKTSDQLLQEMATTLNVEVANSVQDLDNLFTTLKDDIDGLTDADLNLLNANKELLSSTGTLEDETTTTATAIQNLNEQIAEENNTLSERLELLKASTDTEKEQILRSRELDDTLNATNRALLQTIFAEEDRIEALEKEAELNKQIAENTESLEKRLVLTMATTDVEKLAIERQEEINGLLSDSNKDLLKQIHLEEDKNKYIEDSIMILDKLSDTFSSLGDSVEDTINQLLGGSDGFEAQANLIGEFWSKRENLDKLLAKDGDLTEEEQSVMSDLIGDINQLAINIQDASIGDNAVITNEIVSALRDINQEINLDYDKITSGIIIPSTQDIAIVPNLQSEIPSISNFTTTSVSNIASGISTFDIKGLLDTMEEIRDYSKDIKDNTDDIASGQATVSVKES